MKRNLLLILAPVLMTLVSCANLLVEAGLKEEPIPVTNSTYYNQQMSKLLSEVKKNRSRSFRKAAVLDFVNSDGQTSELGKYLGIKFRQIAVSENQFGVIPQGQVEAAMANLKIRFTGSLTEEETRMLGAEVGADAIITGVLADLQKGSDVDLTVKALQTSSAEMISAASVEIYRSKQVQTLLSQF